MYQLLTGATGLLGCYLLRDGLLSGRRVAVLARARNNETAEQRVETIVAGWERNLPLKLPRPVVIPGDLSEPNLGLTQAHRAWIARHCDSVLHSGASLRFIGSDPNDEPWRTNVDGTRHLLEMCQALGICQFHYVSTAYTCGLREGRILESELDVGQSVGNDYERSKIVAERMVHAADFLRRVTIYRPSIIVGDSRTGYTTTFHGFYTPLRAVFSALNAIDPASVSGQPLVGALGLSGGECKNLVPVDWVSAVITGIIDRPAFHGRTYHLTSRKPISVSLITEVMEQAVKAKLNRGKAKSTAQAVGINVIEIFRDQMEVYRTYWRDDPEFDERNLKEALPDLPCPDLTLAVLNRLIDYAIRKNFGWPRPAPVVCDFDVASHLRNVVRMEWELRAVKGGELRVGLQVNGSGGGSWELSVSGDALVAATPGLSEDSRVQLYLNSHTFQRLVAGRLTAAEAIASGQLLVEGERLDELPITGLVQAATTSRRRLDVAAGP